MTQDKVELYGRVFIRGDIRVVTGLHIGGSPAGLAIGGVDNPVIRDAQTGYPYVPGSSLRGKMRSLWEKMTGASQNWAIGKGVRIHVCEKAGDYKTCPVCQIYGVPGQLEASFPTRLVVRDVFLGRESERRLREQAQTDLPYTEVKWEAAIDRVTSAATPRQIERVPADTRFEGLEMVFSVYDPGDLARFVHVLEAMQLLQDDYLGGLGSRGSGKIVFENLGISVRSRQDYGDEKRWDEIPQATEDKTQVSLVLGQSNREKLVAWLKGQISFEPYGA
ncbi:MAG: type III-A CRISPR-associated RAMP protein Csm3 [Anaerolineae bacterium]|nr:type III-A CRISPR-associated RAMP protein Csm3 [Anaerolineae bacterium]